MNNPLNALEMAAYTADKREAEKNTPNFVKHSIYELKEPYDKNNPSFNHVMPSVAGADSTCDCYIFDANSNYHPKHRNKTVKVNWSSIKRKVGDCYNCTHKLH